MRGITIWRIARVMREVDRWNVNIFGDMLNGEVIEKLRELEPSQRAWGQAARAIAPYRDEIVQAARRQVPPLRIARTLQAALQSEYDLTTRQVYDAVRTLLRRAGVLSGAGAHTTVSLPVKSSPEKRAPQEKKPSAVPPETLAEKYRGETKQPPGGGPTPRATSREEYL